MAKNTKAVRRRFEYRQCDDFAAYLNHMARQGWHFKEFRSKLIFEKGEPEDAVYAVEIFTDGTDHDMQPSYKAMNFAEYCEAAGWQLIDQRVKWCVLKRTREDAVPIFTDEERFENVKSVTHCISWKAIFLELLFLPIMFWLIFYLPSTYLFTPSRLLLSIYWPLICIRDIFRTIEYHHWLKDCEARLDRGESLHFRKKRISPLEQILIAMPFLINIPYFFSLDVFGTKIAWILTGIFVALTVLLKCLPSRLRMDDVSSRLTNILFWVIFAFYVFSLMLTASYQQSLWWNSESSSPEQSVYFEEKGKTFSIFGSKETCALCLDEYTFYCKIYQSRYDWVIDVVWKNHSRNNDGTWVDCTEQWDAESAYATYSGYIIRYNDKILVFDKMPTLTQEQIDSIVAALRGG